MRGCCVFNYNPLYRFPIYDEIGKKFEFDIYIGDSIFEQLKSFDVNKLTGFKGWLHAKKIFNSRFIFHTGLKPLFNSDYDTYIVSADSTLLVVWLLLLYAKLFKKRIYLWGHGLKKSVQRPLTRLIYKAFYKSATGVFLYNNYNVKNMLELGCKKERLFVIHNSLDSHLHDSIYIQLKPSNIYRDHFNNDAPNIVFIGRIQKRMKVDQLVSAVRLLKQRGFKVNLTLIGPVIDDSFSGVEESERNNVWIYGACYDEKMTSQLLYDADLCVAPGTVGLTAIHSLSFGTPVITHDNYSELGPEFEAIHDNLTGSFFHQDDITDLAEKMLIWLKTDSVSREEVRKCARQEIINNWHVDAQIRVLTKALEIL